MGGTRLGLRRQVGNSGPPTVRNTDFATDMRKHGRCTAAVLVAVGAREIGATPHFGPQFDEGIGRRQPFQLHAVVGVTAVIAEQRTVHQRRIGKIPHMRMLLVQIADTGTETAALQANAVTKAKRLEPGLLNLRRAIDSGNDGLAAPVRVDIGGQHQLSVIDRETALADALDRPLAVIVATGRPEPGDAALRDILHVLVLALQDQRNLGVETARRAGRRAAAVGTLGLHRSRCRLGCRAGFGLGKFLFESGDALLVGPLHVVDLGTDGSEFGMIGGLRAKGGSQHGSHGNTFLHGILLKIA